VAAAGGEKLGNKWLRRSEAAKKRRNEAKSEMKIMKVINEISKMAAMKMKIEKSK